jgi:hypothetical protein
VSARRPPEVGALFDDVASIQAIRWHLNQHRRDAARTASYIAWLEALEARREAEIAAGTWPPAIPEEAAQTAAGR